LSSETVQLEQQVGVGERISLVRIRQVLKYAYKTGRPAFIYGKPGIGKSSIVRAVSQELGIGFIDLRLSQILPEDLRGFPKINGVKEKQKLVAEDELEGYLGEGWRYLGTLPSGKVVVQIEDEAEERTRWIRSEFLPTSGRGILFLDELPNAEPSKQNAALQLVLDRKLGNYVLPEGWLVMAAGNGAEDRAHVFELSSALNNRFVNIDFPVPTFEEWFEWGAAKIHPGIFGFLKLKPSMMFKFDPRAKERAWPSLRTWEIASDLFKASSNDPSVVRFAVGEGAGIEFEGFARHESLAAASN
jgi:MoxR-like ATPase